MGVVYEVGVGVSNRHAHLTQESVETLFGKGHQLTPYKPLGQPGQYAAEEKVDLVGPKCTFKGVRIIGPARPVDQVEISMTDARTLGIDAPICESGKLAGSASCRIIGPEGEIEIKEGVIVALRHIHLSVEEAIEAGVKDQDLVDVQTYGSRPLLFQDVLIRSGPTHAREFHLDTDEANAAGISSGDCVKIIK